MKVILEKSDPKKKIENIQNQSTSVDKYIDNLAVFIMNSKVIDRTNRRNFKSMGWY